MSNEEEKITLEEIIGEKKEYGRMTSEMLKFENEKMIKLCKEIVFNPNEPLEERFTGLTVLIEHTVMRIAKMQYGLKRLELFQKQFCEKALENYKRNKIAEFTEKWQGKDVCEEMANEMRMIQKPNHCYRFAGIKIIEEDCNLCNNRRCEREEDENSQQSFMELLNG